MINRRTFYLHYESIDDILNAATVNMYRTWCLEGKKVKIKKAIDIASKLIKDGLENNL